MGRSERCAAIVLHTYDIGEAYRLCVLLTRECGKIVARAYGVRRCKSRMGGCLLPLQRVDVTLRAECAGWCICEAALIHPCRSPQPAMVQQGIEMIITLIEDAVVVPDIFTLAEDLIFTCPQSIIPFTIRLFHIMGVLPVNDEDERFMCLSLCAKNFVTLCTRSMSLSRIQSQFPYHDDSLRTFYDALIVEQFPRSLRSTAVVHLLDDVYVKH